MSANLALADAIEADQISAAAKIEEQWDEFVTGRYREGKSEDEFRVYDKTATPGVAEFYRLNHQFQTYDFVLSKEAEYLPLKKAEMSIWEAADFLNNLVDDSDPDTDLSQTEHLMQTSEAIRADGHPRWMVAAGFVHDLAKVLCLWGEPQWAVVGDTFPVGCAHSDQIVFPEYFEANPDSRDPRYNTKFGVYEPHCGLANVHMSWGHDGYGAKVFEPYLPEEAIYMLRYHSFYACHRQGAYEYLMNDHDKAMFEWVKKFNPYDLYSKGRPRPNVQALKPYYDDLFAEFFPAKLAW
jgi:inositol oxygenase